MHRRELCRVAALVACAAGCGRVQFDRRAPPDGSSVVPDAAVDGTGDAGPSCDQNAPFGAPVAIAELVVGAFSSGTLRLLPDELSGYYWAGTSANMLDVFYVSRASLGAPFTRTDVVGINTATNELDPTLTSDGTLLVFRRSNPGNTLHMATVSAADTFTMSMPISSLNASGETQPFFPLGSDRLYFQSFRSGGGDIYVSTRSGTTFSAPTLVPGIATADEEGDVVVSGDELTIYFRSDRPAAQAGFNIYRATRTTTAQPFGAATLLTTVNTAADDGPSWVSSDDCRLYLSSNVSGLNRIYVATRGM